MNDRKPNVTRHRFLTAELSDEEAEQIAATRMDKRHDHLDAACLTMSRSLTRPRSRNERE